MSSEPLVTRLVSAGLGLLYPTRCCFCHRFTEGQRTVCERCRGKYPDVPAAMQEQHLKPVDRCVSPFWYGGEVRESLHRYKFGGLTGYAAVYGEFLAKCLDENGISCDSITWVPLSRQRLRRRGYDQARLLAEAIAAEKNWLCESLLVKTKNTPAQSGTGGREARRANAAGVYRVRDPGRVEGARILLVDDIVTTGETLMECARVLKAAGAAQVFAVTVARRKD